MYARATRDFIGLWGYDLQPESPPEPFVDYKPKDINEFEEGAERDAEDARRRDFRARLHEVRCTSRIQAPIEYVSP